MSGMYVVAGGNEAAGPAGADLSRDLNMAFDFFL